MAKSACWSYVTWFHECSGGKWATWEPGDVINPGDVGRFDKNRRFCHWQTLVDYGVRFTVSDELPVAPHLYSTGKDFRVMTKAAGQYAPDFVGLGTLDAGVRITAERKHACLLQIREATESRILETSDLLTQIAALLRSGKWDLDLLVVVGRIQAKRGFAAISKGAGQSVELKAAGNARLTEVLEIGDAELLLASDRRTTGFQLYEFGSRETPVFFPPIRVKRSLWSKLLPWRAEGPWLIDPAGGRHSAMNLPTELSSFAPEERRYQPQRSAMPSSELSKIAVQDLFEEVEALDDSPAVALEASSHSHSSATLSRRQRQILKIIRESTERLGRPPSRREIGKSVGLLSMSSVSEELSVLERHGHLRGYVVEEIMEQENVSLPLVGQIAAGIPVEAYEAFEDVMQLPKQIVGEGELFLLRVTGDSMINAAIVAGDLVVVRVQPVAENGQIVAAMIDGEATVKTFRRHEGHVWLIPHNPAYTPILGDDATILGRVVAVLRRLS
jgi:repressor LexA